MYIVNKDDDDISFSMLFPIAILICTLILVNMSFNEHVQAEMVFALRRK